MAAPDSSHHLASWSLFYARIHEASSPDQQLGIDLELHNGFFSSFYSLPP
jgi:hypothetical protein